MKTTNNNAASKSAIVKPTEQQQEAATSMTQKIVMSGILWRGNDRMALWAIADNAFMFVFKQELDKNEGYAFAAQVKEKGQITACNWNRVGFATRKQEHKDERQTMLAI